MTAFFVLGNQNNCGVALICRHHNPSKNLKYALIRKKINYIYLFGDLDASLIGQTTAGVVQEEVAGKDGLLIVSINLS